MVGDCRGGVIQQVSHNHCYSALYPSTQLQTWIQQVPSQTRRGMARGLQSGKAEGKVRGAHCGLPVGCPFAAQIHRAIVGAKKNETRLLATCKGQARRFRLPSLLLAVAARQAVQLGDKIPRTYHLDTLSHIRLGFSYLRAH
jgi:hypothetical protein